MSLVWYTNAEFSEGETVDTRNFEYANQAALDAAPEAVQATEALLEDIRAAEFSGAPARLLSAILVPWPDKTNLAFRHDAPDRAPLRKRYGPSYGTALVGGKPKQNQRYWKSITYAWRQEPSGRGTFCYRIEPLPDAELLMVDERWVQQLQNGTPPFEHPGERRLSASSYWSSMLIASPSYLVSGPVRVIRACADPSFLK